MSIRPVRMVAYRTAIPMRSFEHAAAQRDVAEALVVRVAFGDGREGWGETLPRPYVTGETLESVVDDISRTLWPTCREMAIDASLSPQEIPDRDGTGRCILAAACAMDLAMMRRIFDDVTDIAPLRLAELLGRTTVRRWIDVPVSGVLGSKDPLRTESRLKWMRLAGMEHFKLKLGLGEEADEENLRVVTNRLGRALDAGDCTLRVDANGAWDAASVPQRVRDLKSRGVCVVEQPVYCPAGEFMELSRKCELPLMADESLLGLDDARTLLADPKKVWWNIRLSKNGGLLRSLQLARMAAENDVPFTLGCMVGESGILSAAQRRFLQLGAAPRFLEGNYGRWLLADDLTKPSPRFGFAGKVNPLRGTGLGVRVRLEKILQYGKVVAVLE